MPTAPTCRIPAPDLQEYAACPNVAAAAASVAFHSFPCRNSYPDLLAYSGLCFHFDAYRWNDYDQWGFGGNEFSDEHWLNIAAATGVRLRLCPGGRNGSPLSSFREEITANLREGRPFLGHAQNACPFAVGVGYVETDAGLDILWRVRFPAPGHSLEPDGFFRASGQVLALLEGFRQTALSPCEELRHCLRCCSVGRAALDMGWGEVAYGSDALNKAMRDLTRFPEGNSPILSRFQVYSYQQLEKMADYRTQAVAFLLRVLPDLPASLQTPAEDLLAAYERQRGTIARLFPFPLFFPTIAESERGMKSFLDHWQHHRPLLHELYASLLPDEEQAEALIPRLRSSL